MSRKNRSIAFVLLLVMLGDVVLPTAVFALSSGPSQPEVQGFTPASASDIVNIFTGDASYNIPLMDVEGYPINLFYNAGVTMDQEASWVGLGWNLNPGVVERNLRGIPDDFKGDEITRTMNLRVNRTYGVSYDTDLLVFSVSVLDDLENIVGQNQFSLGASVAPSFNNYNGFELELGVSFSMRSTRKGKGSFTGGLGLTSSSAGGLRVQPSLGFDSKQHSHDGRNTTAGLNFGLALDSRAGMTGLSFGASVKSTREVEVTRTDDKGNTKTENRDLSAGGGVRAAFDFGSPAYTPQVHLPMRNTSVSFSFTGGGAAMGGHPNMTLGGSYSEQRLISNVRATPSYGYLHLDAGQLRNDAQLDFNREKDGPFSGDRAALAVTNLTNDFFSVSGQGVSGSYRAFRAEVGHVYDPANGSGGSGGSFGLDLGAGLLAHGGARVSVNSSSSNSQRWSFSTNQAGQRLLYKSLNERPDLERVYFREANEATVQQDSAVWTSMRRAEPVRFTIPSNGAYDNRLGADLTNGPGQATTLPAVNHRTEREPRAKLFTYLDHSMATQFAVDEPVVHLATPKPHHMSEVTVLDEQGGRYVYGLPAYNITQRDVEFNVGANAMVSGSTDLVTYTAQDASVDNKKGKDHYYSCTVTPSYPYAFLLTSILSNDYSDVDDVRGPSDGDLGTWTKFTYTPAEDPVPWRAPVTPGPNQARVMKGGNLTNEDNKASYTYGTKEVYHLEEIVTKNRVARFYKSGRLDARGVNEDGTVVTSVRPIQLDSIALFDKTSAEGGVPLQVVHFDYDYSLCPNTPNSTAVGKGKLTLRKVWFTYGTSHRAATSPYQFTYSDVNPSYKADHQDRWGHYKPPTNGVENAVFPYADQTGAADANAAAWNLTQVRLPSGGRIVLDYEADDYAHVQNRNAMNMVRLAGLNTVTTNATDLTNSVYVPGLYVDQPLVLWFDVPDAGQDWDAAELDHRLFNGIDELYYRCSVKLAEVWDEHDHVSGYARIKDHGVVQNGSAWRGWVELYPVQMDEGQGGADMNPIFRGALEYLQLNYPNEIGGTYPSLDDNQSVTRSFLMTVLNATAGFISGMGDFFRGPNGALRDRGVNYCRSIDLAQSWIRLNDTDRNKNGGGHRVRAVTFHDEWAGMETAEQDEAFSYEQVYTYGDAQGSWGVAAYEPMMGADENPFRQPVYTVVERALTPDQRFYLEEPFGENMFPSPVVGYSRVEVADNLPEDAPAAQGTGKVVHEFYTAKDFPTLVARTGISPGGRRSNNPNIFAILGFKKIDHMHASQGFVVETNDMHGKPRKVTVYPEGSDLPVSYVQYNYGSVWNGQYHKLVNTETVIASDGTIGRADIGVDHEFVADTREHVSTAYSGGADVKFELLYAVIAGIPVPLCLPQLSSESTRYKTGVLVKKIHRFGRLRETVKMENGSVVSTENLAYDATTGNVLVTRTMNDFKDPVYSMSFPANWYYDGMGGAYQNIGARTKITVTNSAFTHPMAAQLYVPGDELALQGPGGGRKVWVDEVNNNTVVLVPKEVNPVPSGTYVATIIRSGRRNMQGVPMMQLTSLANPLEGLAGNVYADLLQASATEFSDQWQTECACFGVEGEDLPLNRWVRNEKGVWRLSRENVWLTERTRSITNDNANIRKDGRYTSFDAFYKVLNSRWLIDAAGWTTAREVTRYNNRGQELENKDALGLYSSATFGYGGSMVKTVARNAQYSETGFDGFEESTDPIACTDKHFRFEVPQEALVYGVSHTGRYSVRVNENGLLLPILINPCYIYPCKIEFEENENGVIEIVSSFEIASVEVEVLFGEVSFSINDHELIPNIAYGWAVKIVVTDSSGCIETRIISKPLEP